MRTLYTILLPVAALLSFLGGPLFLFDTLGSVTGTAGAATIAFGPVLAAAVCSFSLWPAHRLGLGKGGAAAALAAILLLAAMHGFAVSQLLVTPPPQPDFAVFIFGAVMGAVTLLAFLGLAWARFGPATA